MDGTMLLKLPQLSFFCALVETGSISAAAERMHTVPSNITTRIKELEETLECALVNREKQRLTITPEGRAFYHQAHALLIQSQRCLNFFRHQALSGELRVGGLDVAMESHLQDKVVSFMQLHPGVKIEMVCDSSLPLMEQLLGGELDVIIVDGPVEHPTLDAAFFAPESLSLVTHLADLKVFREKAAEMTMFTFGDKCFYHLLIEQWLTANQLAARQVAAIQSYEMILSAIHRGLGFTVMPQTLITGNARIEGLTIIPLAELPSCDLYFVWRKFNQSAIVSAFLEQLNTGLT